MHSPKREKSGDHSAFQKRYLNSASWVASDPSFPVIDYETWPFSRIGIERRFRDRLTIFIASEFERVFERQESAAPQFSSARRMPCRVVPMQTSRVILSCLVSFPRLWSAVCG
ncbi:hypothetical protein BLNAU_23325 [Blattamonas nauphoetae]|uniref:Uncharacterized protein n=1 Tax=Blattamonas nauphoetae TaxID=2049346 RepID=A0ABQ9WQL2_9EUKA|nr:hypothetical protein BLNAU_23325 [Blattamonas nauphoetae]